MKRLLPRIRGSTILQLSPIFPLRTLSTTCFRFDSISSKSTDRNENRAPTKRVPTKRATIKRSLTRPEGLSIARRPRRPGRLNRLPLPRKTEEAFAPKESEIEGLTYRPATSVSGLERVGDLKKWWSQRGIWDSHLKFRPFASQNTVSSRAVLLAVIRRAAIEALALRAAAVAEPERYRGWAVRPWTIGTVADMKMALAVEIFVDGTDGSARLEGEFANPFDLISKANESPLEPDPTKRLVSPKRADLLSRRWHPDWLKMSLADVELKFAV